MRFLSAAGSAALILTSVICACGSTKSQAQESTSSSSSSGSPSTTSSTSGDPTTSSSNGGTTTSSSSGTTQADNFNVTNESMTFSGATRTYILVVPKTPAAATLPLVLSLHGNPGTSQDERNVLPFENVSGNGAVVAYPQSLTNPDGWDQFDRLSDNADMLWMPDLIKDIASKTSVDTTKVLAFGYSGGAYFLNNYTCVKSKVSSVFKAVAVDAGDPACFNVNGCNDGNGNETCISCNGGLIPTLIIHGLNDQEMGPDNGAFTASCVKDQFGCTGDLQAATPTPCQTYAGCPAGGSVEYCGIPNQDHSPWSQADQTAWAWFQALP